MNSTVMTTRYEITLCARYLRRPGLLGRGNPNTYAVVDVIGKDTTTDNGVVVIEHLGRTETIYNTRDPDWVKPIYVETTNTQLKPLCIKIYHRDKLLCTANVDDVYEIYKSKGKMREIDIPKKGYKIEISVEESIQGTIPRTNNVSLHIRGMDIKNVEPGFLGLGRSDPYFEVAKKIVDHAAGIVRWKAVYRSEHIDNHLNPYWKQFNVNVEELCYCNLEHPIRILVKDRDHHKIIDDKLIGQIETSIREFQNDYIAVKGNADREKAMELYMEGKTKARGLIVVLKVDITTTTPQEEEEEEDVENDENNNKNNNATTPNSNVV